MSRLRFPAAVLPLLASLAMATPAGAHYVSVYPRYGYPGTVYAFKGTLWQPSRTVSWWYDESNDGDFERRGSFIATRFGGFRFTWSGEDIIDTHRMCFRQYDSRLRFRRTFFVCRLFTYDDPSAPGLRTVGELIPR